VHNGIESPPVVPNGSQAAPRRDPTRRPPRSKPVGGSAPDRPAPSVATLWHGIGLQIWPIRTSGVHRRGVHHHQPIDIRGVTCRVGSFRVANVGLIVAPRT
jgi:hypothetical protein